MVFMDKGTALIIDWTIKKLFKNYKNIKSSINGV